MNIQRVDLPICEGLRIVAVELTEGMVETAFIEISEYDGSIDFEWFWLGELVPLGQVVEWINDPKNSTKGMSCGTFNTLEETIEEYREESEE